MNDIQRARLKERWEANPTLDRPFDERDFHPATTMDALPEGYYVGMLGSIFIGISPEGAISS